MLRKKQSLGKARTGASCYRIYVRLQWSSLTGFAPLQLLYGHSVHGLLNIVREAWEAETRSLKSVVSYVLVMQEKLSKMTELVKDNLAQAQSNQKNDMTAMHEKKISRQETMC